jgi:hypothetical protein
MRRRALVLVGLLCAGCDSDPSLPARPSAGPSVSPASPDPAGGAAERDRLTVEARALARTGPCAAVSACKAAAVGRKPCGGPREFWLYCSSATNEAELLGKLARVAELEIRHPLPEAPLTCDIVPAPVPQLVGTECGHRSR